MRYQRSTPIELTVAVLGLVLGVMVGLWLATQPTKIWRPRTILASTRAQVVGQDDNALGRVLGGVGRSGLVFQWYVEKSVPFIRSQPLLALGLGLIVVGLAVYSAMDRIGRRQRLDLDEAQRRAPSSLAHPLQAARRGRVKASGLSG